MAEVGSFYQSKYTGDQIDEILKNVYDAVPIDGSKPMTAPLTIKEVENGYTQLEKNHTQTTDLGTALRDVSKGGSVVALLLKAADQAARLQFGASVYDLIHTGNIQPYVKPYADTAQAASEAAESALEGVREAIEAIPDGAATPIVNDLTTGGTSMALSAEMGKVLKTKLDGLTPEDIGAGRLYTNLVQLGLTIGVETIENIFLALPLNGRLRYTVTGSHNSAIYPYNYGIIEFIRVNTASYGECTFTAATNNAFFNRKWIGSANISGNTCIFSGWEEVATTDYVDALTPEDIEAVRGTGAYVFGPRDMNALPLNRWICFEFNQGIDQTPYHTPLGGTTVSNYTVFTSGADNRTVQLAFLPFSHQRQSWVRFKHDTSWSEWYKLATSDYAVNKAGDTMTGALGLGDGYGEINVHASAALLQARNVKNDATNRRALALYNSKGMSALKNAIRLLDTVDGTTTNYDILHTGNKPSGSYTGNGSATERTITAGGLGKNVIIRAGVIITLVSGDQGGVSWNTYNGTFKTFPASEVSVNANGDLVIASTADSLNVSGLIYNYEWI